jgi:flagellar protein FliO/FliZ
MINTTARKRAGNAGNVGVKLAIVCLLLAQPMFATAALGDDAELPQNQPSLQNPTTPQDQTTPQNETTPQNQATLQNQPSVYNATSAPASTASTPASQVKSPAAGVPKSAPATGRYLVSLTLGLLAIVGLIFALAWLVKRMGQGSFVNNNHLKILAVMPLGTRERLVIVQAGEQQLLLGITASQINTLHVFPEQVIQPDAKTPSDFGKKMLAVLQKNNRSPSVSNQRRTVALDDSEQP